MDDERLERIRIQHADWRQAKTRADLARKGLEREIREAVALGERPADIARRCGVTRQAVQRWLRNAGARP